jgi:transposase-like protein
MSILSKPYFHDEAAAFEHLEEALWRGEPVCPHCGSINNTTKLQGQATRIGVWKCKDRHCRKQFTVKVGTVFEHGRIPLSKMLQAVHLMVSSKKGISAHQLHRTLEIQYKSAWFLAHRIREAMRDGSLAPLGSGGGIVEADETFIGREPGKPKKRAYHHKMKVLSLLDRQSGQTRSMVVDNLKPATLTPILEENIAKEARVMTDEAGQYFHLNKSFSKHGVVRHGREEYVRQDAPHIHTNTIEGYFSIFKRGMKGTYQHCAKKHLHRYLAEFDFRYNNRVALGIDDTARAENVAKGLVGKRLTYRRLDVATA